MGIIAKSTVKQDDRTYYVSKAGSDSQGTVGDINRPFLTVQAAINAAEATTPTGAAPAIVQILGGIYTEDVTLSVENVILKGDANFATLKIEGEPGLAPTVIPAVPTVPEVPAVPGTTAVAFIEDIGHDEASMVGESITFGTETWTGVNGAPANGFEFDASSGNEAQFESFITQFNANNTQDFIVYWMECFGNPRTPSAFTGCNGLAFQSDGIAEDQSVYNGIAASISNSDFDYANGTGIFIDEFNNNFTGGGTAGTPSVPEIPGTPEQIVPRAHLSTFIDGTVTIDTNGVIIDGIRCIILNLINDATNIFHAACSFSRIVTDTSILAETRCDASWKDCHSPLFLAEVDLNGPFENCSGGDTSFAGANGYKLTGVTMTNCEGGDNCFGNYQIDNSTFTDCSGGVNCFGVADTAGSYISNSVFINCILKDGGFNALDGINVLFSDCKANTEAQTVDAFYSNPSGLAVTIDNIRFIKCECYQMIRCTASTLTVAQDRVDIIDCIAESDSLIGDVATFAPSTNDTLAIERCSFGGTLISSVTGDLNAGTILLQNCVLFDLFDGENAFLGSPAGGVASSGVGISIFNCSIARNISYRTTGFTSIDHLTMSNCTVLGEAFDLGANSSMNANGNVIEDVSLYNCYFDDLFRVEPNVVGPSPIIGKRQSTARPLGLKIYNCRVNFLFRDKGGNTAPTVDRIIGDDDGTPVPKGSYVVEILNCEIDQLCFTRAPWKVRNMLVSGCVTETACFRTFDVSGASAITELENVTLKNHRHLSSNVSLYPFREDYTGLTHLYNFIDVTLDDFGSVGPETLFGQTPFKGLIKNTSFKPTDANQAAIRIADGTIMENCTFVPTGTGDPVDVPGDITLINVTAGGSGYTTAPTVDVTGDGENEVLTAVLGDGVITAFDSFTAGSADYGTNSGTQTVSLIRAGQVASTGSGATADVTFSPAGTITNIVLNAAGSGYDTVDDAAPMTIDLSTLADSTPPTTEATIDIACSGGFVDEVASVDILSPGSGFTSAPTIGFTGDGAGATATATVTTAINAKIYQSKFPAALPVGITNDIGTPYNIIDADIDI